MDTRPLNHPTRSHLLALCLINSSHIIVAICGLKEDEWNSPAPFVPRGSSQTCCGCPEEAVNTLTIIHNLPLQRDSQLVICLWSDCQQWGMALLLLWPKVAHRITYNSHGCSKHTLQSSIISLHCQVKSGRVTGSNMMFDSTCLWAIASKNPNVFSYRLSIGVWQLSDKLGDRSKGGFSRLEWVCLSGCWT